MSKIKFFIVAVFSVLAFCSCEKEVNLVETDENLIEDSVVKLTEEFIEKEASVKVSQAWLESSSRIPPWLEIALSDIIGGAVGTLTAGPVGGVILGVGCSIAAGTGIAPPPNGGGVGNSNNSYDYTGEYHVNILHYCLTEQSNFVFVNGVFNFDNYVQIADQILISNGIMNSPSGFSASTFGDVLNYVANAGNSSNNSMSVIFSNMGNEGLLTTVESGILASYFNAFENSNSFNSFLQYSIAVENSISQSNLSSSSKEKLLVTMSTARHDINYWKNL